MRPEATAHTAPAERVIRVEGVFDGLAARRVERLLSGAAENARFHLDLTQIREFQDFGLAVLAQAMATARARVTVRGLRQHQVRILRYFGVETAQIERAVIHDAA